MKRKPRKISSSGKPNITVILLVMFAVGLLAVDIASNRDAIFKADPDGFTTAMKLDTGDHFNPQTQVRPARFAR